MPLGQSVEVMVGATAGTDGSAGLVPKPLAGDQSKFVRGDGTLATIAGGGDMLAANNLSDVANPATARTNLGAAPLASPALTGTPTAPTASDGTNTTQIASTAFVQAALALASYIDGEVATHANLPVTVGTPPVDSAYLVRTATGIWTPIFSTRKPAGIWVRDSNGGTLADWRFAGTFPDVMNAANFALYDGSDTSKELGFVISGFSTATKRLLTILNKSYTVEETGHASKHVSGGSDAIKLDDLAAPDDNTDGDATTSAHGLMPKADKAKLNKLAAHGADIASASTIDLDAATGDLVDVTGTTGITAITLADGIQRVVRFTGALTLTHGSSLVLPGAANITTAAGDFAIFRGYAAGVVRCVSYTKADGTPVVGGGWTSGLLFTTTASTKVIDGTVTETSIFSGTIPANTLAAAGSCVKVLLHGLWLNNSGTSYAPILRVKLGGTTLYQDTSQTIGSTAFARAVELELTIWQDNSSSAQRLCGRWIVGAANAVTTGYSDLSNGVITSAIFGATGAKDSTGALTLDITMEMPSNDPALEFTTHKASCWRV